jgi:hypothetical protein
VSASRNSVVTVVLENLRSENLAENQQAPALVIRTKYRPEKAPGARMVPEIFHVRHLATFQHKRATVYAHGATNGPARRPRRIPSRGLSPAVRDQCVSHMLNFSCNTRAVRSGRNRPTVPRPRHAKGPPMHSTVVRRVMIFALASLVLTPFRAIQAADQRRPKSSPPLFGHHRQQTCAQNAHERIRAMMAGVPWVASRGTPTATNLDCR